MPIVNVVIIQQWEFLVFHLNKKTIYGLRFQNDPICHTPFFLYKHEGKFTPASIMLSFLRISGSNYAYDMLNTLTANYEYSRGNTENLPLPTEMELS